ncbi:hypothetical protein CWI38_0206p0020 [Hamiltosporidium tvaerminnensis]|uniref:CNH domain-containing protein n=1 Tax=Hamiltosporidium tvaerminnensis TaxID=1176355 RepID=A0A4Q9M263_9MICR|nr:hypothetical protein CWI38_0206p0020 [Hamiltosporidium tvaerminnensis]
MEIKNMRTKTIMENHGICVDHNNLYAFSYKYKRLAICKENMVSIYDLNGELVDIISEKVNKKIFKILFVSDVLVIFCRFSCSICSLNDQGIIKKKFKKRNIGFTHKDNILVIISDDLTCKELIFNEDRSIIESSIDFLKVTKEFMYLEPIKVEDNHDFDIKVKNQNKSILPFFKRINISNRCGLSNPVHSLHNRLLYHYASLVKSRPTRTYSRYISQIFHTRKIKKSIYRYGSKRIVKDNNRLYIFNEEKLAHKISLPIKSYASIQDTIILTTEKCLYTIISNKKRCYNLLNGILVKDELAILLITKDTILEISNI